MSKIVKGEHEQNVDDIGTYSREIANLLWDNLSDIKLSVLPANSEEASNLFFKDLVATGWIGGIGKYPSSALKDIESLKAAMPDHPETERLLRKKIRAIQNCLIIERNRASLQYNANKSEMCKIIKKYSGLNNVKPKSIFSIDLNVDCYAKRNYIMQISFKAIEYRTMAFSEAPTFQLAEALINLGAELRKKHNFECLLKP